MPSQQEIADHLDLSQQTVSELIANNLSWKFFTVDEFRIAYIRRLRAQAAGRSVIGDLDLASERARLAKEQADRVAMQNALARSELAPVSVIERVLSAAAAKVAAIFDAIPGAVRRRHPDLTHLQINLIAEEIAKARNIVAAMTLADITGLHAADGPADASEEVIR